MVSRRSSTQPPTMGLVALGTSLLTRSAWRYGVFFALKLAWYCCRASVIVPSRSRRGGGETYPVRFAEVKHVN